MEKIKIKINGQEIEASAEKTILEVVRENKLDDIPTLCYSPELEPYGSCFLCTVEIKGRSNLVPSCATKIVHGMEIETRNERILASRKTALELLISNHYADCISPCSEGCPAGVNAQSYIALSAMGQYKKAVDLIRERNPLPAICGRVCVRKCEVLCRRSEVDKPVNINAIKRFVTDAPGIYDGVPQCDPPTGKTVAIIGAGPAGLTTAWFLGKKGHKPVLYEAQARPGGMLRYGIPAYRLANDVLDAEVEYICKTGTEINYNVVVGKDITLDELRKKHNAVFIGIGAWAGKPMRVEGEFDTEGIVTGTDFLKDNAKNPQNVKGEIVVVVGGGDVAIDVARTAWRLGAEKVTILYRRTKKEMPADEREIEDCLDEGIELMELAAPVGIVAEGGKLKALRCIRMKLGNLDESGRRRPVPLKGSDFELPCQMVVSAIGQAPVLDGLGEVNGKKLGLTKWGTIVVDPETMKTNIDGVFAGGDTADDGPTVVIDAVRDGQVAARAIHAYLTGKKISSKPFTIQKEFWSKPGQTELGDVKESPRHEVHMLDVESRRGNFTEVATGFDYEDSVHECQRCLSCGCVKFDDCKLRRYAEQYGVDMNKFKGYVRKHKVDERHPYIVYDPNKCILCARCIRTCAKILPISAIGLVERGFKTEMRPAMNDPLVKTSCVSCGNCIDSCPTGAITMKYPFPGRASFYTDDVQSNCGFCSLACPITVKKIVDTCYYIEPSGVPGQYLCRYGRFGHELFIKQNRITTSEIRSGSERRKVEIHQAQKLIVSEMRRVAEKCGPDKVAVFVSPELTNEEQYLAGRIARDGLGSNNVASLSILGIGNEAGILDESFGYTASTADMSCLDDADLIICNNTAMESDHLILAMKVIQVVRDGAKLIVSNSTLGTTDQLLSSLAMDPMRGRATILWNGIMQILLDKDHFKPEIVKNIPGAAQFRANRNFQIERVSDLSGVDKQSILKAAEIIHDARSLVFIHSPDRPQDQAPGDVKTLANFIVLLKTAGFQANLLLPRTISNSAGLEIMGASPAFEFGRVPRTGKITEAKNHEQLRDLLANGELKAALVIGEDPMAWAQSGSWFQNIEFLAAMDSASTETTQYADVVLPGSTYLETSGTRCNFEGKVIEFSQAVEPPAGVCGKEILRTLAAEFGIETAQDISREIQGVIEQKLGSLSCFYWNTGQQRTHDKGMMRLVVVDTGFRTSSIQPPLTQGEKYKKGIRDIGTDRFRVRS